MVKDILEAVGLSYKKSRFLKPPNSIYAVYTDDSSGRGSDEKNLLTEHNITIEVYSKKINEEMEIKIENELDERGIEYKKQDWYYIESEQLFQLIYEFSYIKKKGI